MNIPSYPDGPVQKRIDQLRPWFHSIECRPGLRIDRDVTVYGEPADHPKWLWDLLHPWLPADLRGCRVLDVGCNAGFFALALTRAGADLLGIDVVPRHLEQARLVRELSGFAFDVRQLSVYDVMPALGTFDLTLCLGVVYHLKHPLFALERLAAVTTGVLAVESAIIPEISELSGPMYGGLARPMVFLEQPEGTEEPGANWTIPSLSGLRSWLGTVGFGTIDASLVVQDRGLVVCRRTAVPAAG